MMGNSHAISGAAVWMTGWAVAAACGAHPGPAELLVGAGLMAGGALYPDIDHPGSRISNCGGPLTRALSHGHAAIGRRVHAATRLPADKPDLDGHRTITHTWAFGILIGAIFAVVAGGGAAAVLSALVNAAVHATDGAVHRVLAAAHDSFSGSYNALVVAAIVYFFAKIGADAAVTALPGPYRRVRLPGSRRRVRLATLLALAAASLAGATVPGDTWWIGVAIGGGIVVHTVGDLITMQGCPVLWPIPVGRRELRWQRVPGTPRRAQVTVRVWRMWYLVASPRTLRFRVNSPTERIVRVWLIIIGLCSTGIIAWLAC